MVLNALIRGISFIICLSQAALAAAGGAVSFELENPYGVYTHAAEVRVIHMTKSDWRPQDIHAHLSEAANVYAQCGIKLKVAGWQTVNSGDGVVVFDLEGYTDPKDVREEAGALNLAKTYADRRQVNIVFMQSFDPDFGSITATAVPAIRAKTKEQKVALNTIWLAHRIERQWNADYSQGGFHSGYSVLAHEMGHVLLNAGHIEEPNIYNLMHAWGQNRNGRLTVEQCLQIKKSVAVRPIAGGERRKSICPKLDNTIFGGVYFAIGAEKNCQQLGLIGQNMSHVQDVVSDLQPVKHVDFYLEPPKSQLMYLDRQAFSASMTPTYDDVGRVLLKPGQSEKLWWHELGHAILNAQLVVDWPWYRERDKLMVRWGRQVYQETLNENNYFINGFVRNISRSRLDMNIFNGIFTRFDSSEIIKEINSLPHLTEFDEILGPYHEFFSDALVVIYTRDPEVMKHALQHPECFHKAGCWDEQNPDIMDRDYSFLRNVDTWSVSEVHNTLTPSLAYLWTKIRTARVRERSQKVMLRAVYRALSDEVLERADNPDLWKMSSPEANRRLIRKLDQYLK